MIHHILAILFIVFVRKKDLGIRFVGFWWEKDVAGVASISTARAQAPEFFSEREHEQT